MRLLIASGNSHKVAEISRLLASTSWQVVSLRDYPELELPPEDADSFAGNAEIKARAGVAATGLWTLADDSGLVVDYLDGAPGVHSARFAGDEKDDAANNAKLLAAMQDCPAEQRTARFVCALVLAGPEGQVFCTEGRCEGRIGYVGRGEQGFGYDPLFWLADPLRPDVTMAELSMEEKNTLSHRAAALREMLPRLIALAEAEH